MIIHKPRIVSWFLCFEQKKKKLVGFCYDCLIPMSFYVWLPCFVYILSLSSHCNQEYCIMILQWNIQSISLRFSQFFFSFPFLSFFFFFFKTFLGYNPILVSEHSSIADQSSILTILPFLSTIIKLNDYNFFYFKIVNFLCNY